MQFPNGISPRQRNEVVGFLAREGFQLPDFDWTVREMPPDYEFSAWPFVEVTLFHRRNGAAFHIKFPEEGGKLFPDRYSVATLLPGQRETAEEMVRGWESVADACGRWL